MTPKQFAGLIGFLFVAAWASLTFGDALLCLIGGALFYAAAALYEGELDLGELQQRVPSPQGRRPPR